MLLAFTWAACIFLFGLVIMAIVFDDNISQFEYEDEDMFEYKERSIKLRIQNIKSKL
jgi:hypothetical protein